ncbi:MAG: hypothetical protein ABI668_05785 [Sphingorhabdus sp.]
MVDHRRELLDLIVSPDAFGQSAEDLAPLQLAAAQQVFEQQHSAIPILARRADEAGITNIASLHDLVPLLLAHTAYKSYPTAFVEKNRWDRMNHWLSTVSTPDFADVDVSGVENADQWIARLGDHGHLVLATSGTSGKCSFLNASRHDRALKERHFKHVLGWPETIPANDREVFWLGPIEGPNSAIEAGIISRDVWARPGGFHALITEPLRISDVSQMAAFTKRMAEGSATPEEIAAFQNEAQAKGKAMRTALAAYTDTLLAHRHEPIILSGLWAQMLQIIERARELGVPDGDFHPQTRVNAGGGIKGVTLPDDYKEQVARFFGDVQRPGAYGMTEMAQMLPRCEAGHYHRAPGLILLLLDESGERLINADDGLVEGRFAFLDLLYEGRWGGLISGDKVMVDFAPNCACGRPGPVILDTITRFAASGDDHIGCAGTIDSYVRGVVGA